MTTTKEELERDYNAMVRDLETVSAEADELRVELMAAKERIKSFERNEYICKRCHLRQQSGEKVEVDF